jgi:hypothetical protein
MGMTATTLSSNQGWTPPLYVPAPPIVATSDDARFMADGRYSGSVSGGGSRMNAEDDPSRASASSYMSQAGTARQSVRERVRNIEDMQSIALGSRGSRAVSEFFERNRLEDMSDVDSISHMSSSTGAGTRVGNGVLGSEMLFGADSDEASRMFEEEASVRNEGLETLGGVENFYIRSVKQQLKESSRDRRRLLAETRPPVAVTQAGLGLTTLRENRMTRRELGDGVLPEFDLGGLVGPPREVRERAMELLARDTNRNGVGDAIESLVVGAPPSSEEVADLLRMDADGDGRGDVLGAAMQGETVDMMDTDEPANPGDILTGAERATFEASDYMHPLRDPFVTDLPPLQKDDDKSLYCFKDCIERERIRLKECDEVRKRVISQLKTMGCHSIAIPIKTNTACGISVEDDDEETAPAPAPAQSTCENGSCPLRG